MKKLTSSHAADLLKGASLGWPEVASHADFRPRLSFTMNCPWNFFMLSLCVEAS